MASPNLNILTSVNIAPLESGMGQAAGTVRAATTQMKESFATTAAAAQAATAHMVAALEAQGLSVEEVRSALINQGLSAREAAAAVGAAQAQQTAAVVKSSQEQGFALDRLRERFTLTAHTARLSATEIGSAFSGLGILLGAGLMGTVLANLAHSFIENAVAIHKFSEETGVSIERAYQLQLISQLLHLNFETLETSIVRLTRNLVAAAEGSKTQAELFRRMGVDVKAFTAGQIDALDVLDKMRQKFQGSTDAGLVLGVAMQLLGRGARETSILLKLTDTQMAALRAQTAGTAAELAKQNASWVQLQRSVTELWQTLRGPMGAALLFVIEAVKGLIAGLAALSLGFQALAAGILIGGAAITDFVGITHGAARGLADDFAKIKKAHEDLVAELAKPVGKAPDVDLKGAPLDVSDIVGSAKTRLDVWKESLEQMRMVSDEFHGLDKLEEADFWGSILETEKLNAKERLAVENLYMAASKAATRDYYNFLVEAQREVIAATKAGTAERINAEEDLAEIIKALPGEESLEYQRQQRAVVAARLEANHQQLADSIREAEEEAAQYKAGATERITIYRTLADRLNVIQADYLNRSQAALNSGLKIEANMYLTFARQVEEMLHGLNTKLATAEREHTAQIEAEAKRLALKKVELATTVEKAQEAEGVKNLSRERKQIEELARMGAISYEQKAALLVRFADEEYAIRLRAFDNEIRLWKEAAAQNVAIQKEALEKIEELEKLREVLKRGHEDALNRISDEGVIHRIGQEVNALNKIQTAFQSTFDSMLRGSETFVTGMQKLWNTLVIDAANALLKILQAHITHWIMVNILERAGIGTKATTESKGAAASIGASASAGAAAAFASVLEALPFPANVAAAPGVAAAEFGEIMAFEAGALAGGIGIAQRGALLPSNMLVAAHMGEMILPAHIASGMRRIIDYNARAGARATVEEGAASGGGTINLTINAMDAKSVRDLFEKEGPALAKVVQRQIRQGAFG